MSQLVFGMEARTLERRYSDNYPYPNCLQIEVLCRKAKRCSPIPCVSGARSLRALSRVLPTDQGVAGPHDTQIGDHENTSVTRVEAGGVIEGGLPMASGRFRCLQ